MQCTRFSHQLLVVGCRWIQSFHSVSAGNSEKSGFCNRTKLINAFTVFKFQLATCLSILVVRDAKAEDPCRFGSFRRTIQSLSEQVLTVHLFLLVAYRIGLRCGNSGGVKWCALWQRYYHAIRLGRCHTRR